jgi:hypothetical protein
MRTVRSLVARYPSLQARAAWLALGVLAVVAGIVAARSATAQEVAATAELQSAEQLGELVGPIALYPDDLVGIVLPASTYPLQIVQAARFLDERRARSVRPRCCSPRSSASLWWSRSCSTRCASGTR